MTTAIKASLSNLSNALQGLEQSANGVQASVRKPSSSKAGQNDLFSTSASNDLDTKALASRLDGAIAKVEKLLREGESHG